MRDYAAAPDFKVLRQDSAAHIVQFPAQHIVGYVLFAATTGLTLDALAGADSPCLVMTHQKGDRLVLSIADPDLRLPGQPDMVRPTPPGDEGRLRLRLNGAWQLAGTHHGVRQVDDRTLEVITREGATREVTLVRRD